MDKLDKEFYEQADILLGFTDNAYEYFSKGNIKQKRKILEIISDEITYKDKHFDIKLKPIFKTIAQNQYNLVQISANNRTLENGIIKGVEPNSTPNNRKNSPGVLDFDNSKTLTSLSRLCLCRFVGFLKQTGWARFRSRGTLVKIRWTSNQEGFRLVGSQTQGTLSKTKTTIKVVFVLQ